MNLSEAQILQLAPDEASKKAGIGLSGPAKWVSKGQREQALWGECQGSGSKPYQTQIDLHAIAFKCSCPSRKFPCKHGLGLLLLYEKQPAVFALAAMPAWVEEWMSKRAGKEEKTDKVERKADEAAQAKRKKNRGKKVAEGIDELFRWIKDIVRSGFMNLPDRQPAYWELMAKRMIDAQAGGLAIFVKELGKINFYTEGWQTNFIDQLLNLYLLASAYKNIASLPEITQADIRNRIGFTQSQEELKALPIVADTWLVLGKQVSQDDQLTVERFWLHGIATGKYAMVMQFVVRGQGAELTLTPGMYIQAELVFYPSVLPLRALIKTQVSAKAMPLQHMASGWKNLLQEETAMYVQLPFSFVKPFIIQQVIPVLHNRQWWLQDANSDLMEVDPGFPNIWKLLAISGGRPLNTAIIGKDNVYEPIGVWDDNTYKSF